MSPADTPDPSELFDRLVNGDTTRKAVEEAIFLGLQKFAETTNKEITALVESNTQPPDVKEEMLKLRKTVIDLTTEAVKNGPLNYLNGKSKSG